MLGAIVGDIIGSTYEGRDLKGFSLPFFTAQSRPTDETYLLLATADVIRHQNKSFAEAYREAYRKDPEAGYGAMFSQWAEAPDMPAYGSYGNGAASRVAPVAQLDSLDEVLAMAEASAMCTHNSDEGIRSAKAVAQTIWLARNDHTPEQVRELISLEYYPLYYDLEELHENFSFCTDAEVTVPVALWIALSSESFQEVMRKGLYVGGDTDTILSIAGAVAEALFGVPLTLKKEVLAITDKYEITL